MRSMRFIPSAILLALVLLPLQSRAADGDFGSLSLQYCWRSSPGAPCVGGDTIVAESYVLQSIRGTRVLSANFKLSTVVGAS